MTLAKLMNDNFSLIQYGEFFLRLIIACICGALIGYERSRRYKEAGLRTHIIVCCAAALMMIISKYGFADLADASYQGGVFPGARGADPARIAAQIVSGISFLGAGIIFHTNNTVKGLSTAAGVWATAGIGMAVGSGMYVLGIFSTALLLIIQVVIHKFEVGKKVLFTNQLRFTVKNTEAFRKAFAEYIENWGGVIVESKIKFNEDGYVSYNVTIRTAKEITIDELNLFLEANGEVKSVSCVSMN